MSIYGVLQMYFSVFIYCAVLCTAHAFGITYHNRILINFREGIHCKRVRPQRPWSPFASLGTEVFWHNYAHFPLWSNNNFGRNYFAH